MNTVTKLVLILRDIFILVLLVATFVVSALATKTPYQKPIISFGNYQISSFESGIAIFQLGRYGPYYTVSPLNDYAIKTGEYRKPFISWEDFSADRFVSRETNQLTDIYDTLKSYFNSGQILYNLATPMFAISYRAENTADGVSIERFIEYGSPVSLEKLGITLRYESSDFIFDTSDFYLYDHPGLEDTEELNSILPVKLKALDIKPDWGPIKVVSGEIAILNPDFTGILVVSASKGQELWIDHTYNLVELVQYPNGYKKTFSSTLRVSSKADITELIN